ncbi:type II secretion system protein GspD [Variovorax sp. ZT4R33]|uniref:type II secretion system protein GspD n=1 Tax=Variovorax sp. ZT4R33 TaxID=3443743 RepID=UPI003F4899CB
MKRWRLALSLAASIAHAAPNNEPASFDLREIRVAQVVQLVYGEVIKTPYMLEPEVLADNRIISFRYGARQGDLDGFMRAFLSSLGYVVDRRAGVDFIAKKREEEAKREVFVYKPMFRDVAYLSRLLAPLFKGSFAVNRSVRASEGARPEGPVPDGSAAALIDQDADVLVFTGIQAEIDQLERVLPQVDKQAGDVRVDGVVYEVSSSDKTGSGFGLLASILGGKLSIGVGSTANLGSFIQFKSTSLDAIYSALASDSRFKVLSSPSLRIRSGSRGTFSVGQDVPILGALSFPQGAGQAVQSVEYKSSGVIFDIRPTVRDAVIDLNVSQQLSNFVSTTTGVNNSPTLTKRELKTSVSLQDKEIIVLGGLSETKDSETHDGLSFLPKFLHTKGTTVERSEILLVLQVQRL